MKKNFLITLAFVCFGNIMLCNAAPVTTPVVLHLFKIDKDKDKGSYHKGPVQIPSIALDGHTLYFFTPCDGDTLRLVDEDGVVVYSLVIPDGSSSLELPATLSGEYELQIIRGNFCFWGAVML